MQSNIEKYKNDLDKLITTGDNLYELMTTNTDEFLNNYEIWYSEALEVIRQILPNRLESFQTLYKENNNNYNYTISQYLTIFYITNKDTQPYFGQAIAKFRNQLAILKASKNKFESSLFDIKQLLQADIFDSEIDAARELLKNGFLRPAGAVAGVVLEHHLSQVCQKHNILIEKNDPVISTFNDALKKEEVINTPDWRFIQRLGDLRNLCSHKKEEEPKKNDVEELIAGVDKITKTIF